MESDEKIQMAVRKVMYRSASGQHASRIAEATNELFQEINNGRREAVAQAFDEAAEELDAKQDPVGMVVVTPYLREQAEKFRSEVVR